MPSNARSIQVIAVPCYQDKFLYFPLVPADLDPQQHGLNKYFNQKFADYSKYPPDSWRGKIAGYHARSESNQTVGDKFLEHMPSSTDSLQIFYPARFDSRVLTENLKNSVAPNYRSGLAKTALFGMLLPVAVVIDIFTIGFLLTLGDSVALASSFRNWRVSRSVTNMLQQGNAIQWIPHPALQAFADRAQMQNGIPSDADFDTLGATLGLPHLAAAGKALRDAEIRRRGPNSAVYPQQQQQQLQYLQQQQQPQMQYIQQPQQQPQMVQQYSWQNTQPIIRVPVAYTVQPAQSVVPMTTVSPTIIRQPVAVASSMSRPTGGYLYA